MKSGGVLTALAALVLTACGGGSGSPTIPANPGAGSPPPTSTPTPTPSPSPTPTPVPSLTTADYSLQPVFLCVYHQSGPTFYLRFGYRNLNAFDVQVARGSTDAGGVQLNAMTIGSGEGGSTTYTQQPDMFLKGDQTANTQATFDVPVGGEGTATWYLAGNETTGAASETAPQCTTKGNGSGE